MSKSPAKHAERPSRSARDTQHPLVPIVRDTLAGLGDFEHLTVYRQGDHLFIAHVVPSDARNDVDPCCASPTPVIGASDCH
jgi:hypothetical protein